MTLSIVIPNYNGKHLLQKNLPYVFRECESLPMHINEIIIVDDASQDGSADWIEGFCHGRNDIPTRVIVLENHVNSGFSTTANKGILRATGDIVVLLNTDVRPQKGFLNATLPRFENPTLFGVGFMDKSIEGEKTVYRGRGVGWWEKGMYVHRKGAIDMPETSWISGGSCAIRRAAFLKLKGFNEIYNPFYWEDIDLSYRAVKAGYQLWFEQGSVVIHEHNDGAIRSGYSLQDITRIAYRNQIIFIWKNATVAQFVSHLLWLPYHILNTMIRGDSLFLVGYAEAVARVFSYR
jgi:GT2 family glycosyltransferase